MVEVEVRIQQEHDAIDLTPSEQAYQQEKWNAMLCPLFSTWYACVRKLGDMELMVRLLVEMIGYGVSGWLIPWSLHIDLVLQVIGNINKPETASGRSTGAAKGGIRLCVCEKHH